MDLQIPVGGFCLAFPWLQAPRGVCPNSTNLGKVPAFKTRWALWFRLYVTRQRQSCPLGIKVFLEFSLKLGRRHKLLPPQELV